MKKIIFPAIAALSIAAASAQMRTVHIPDPDLTVYLPSPRLATGQAVVACPGGGYAYVATAHEGHDWAPFFTSQGIAFAVLNYRLPAGNPEIPIADVDAAYKILADSASIWHIDPTQTGIMGSSAGGHLASTVATRLDGDFHPAFQILFYPVISLDGKITHQGSRNNFIGDKADDKLAEAFSSEKRVSGTTPPAFIALSINDKIVAPENSLRYIEEMSRFDRPVYSVILPEGDHGWGYRPSMTYFEPLTGQLKLWLSSLKTAE